MTIQPLPPMPQLKLNTEGKPAIPSWVAPPETKLDDIQWQPLRTLDLALLDGTPEHQKECQETFAAAVKNEGFVLIKNFGVAPAVVSCGSRADCDGVRARPLRKTLDPDPRLGSRRVRGVWLTRCRCNGCMTSPTGRSTATRSPRRTRRSTSGTLTMGTGPGTSPQSGGAR
jgi:hypothetical protein